MTEAEWATSTDLQAMLRLVLDRVSERRLRLLACACWRWRAGSLDNRKHSGSLLEAVERVEAWVDAGSPARDRLTGSWYVTNKDNRESATLSVDAILATEHFRPGNRPTRDEILLLYRCLFGDPFRPPRPRRFPSAVLGLARACYEELPVVSDQYLILSDALADLDEEQAAAHCRQPMHVRGCRVLDWILGMD